jgi:bcr-type benzoyl-CoA reductase subunit C
LGDSAVAKEDMTQDPIAQKLTDLITNPYHDWASRHPGRRAFGYLCTYAPLEILHAAGFTPIRLMQLSHPVSLADAHLPSFSCALARGVTERLVSGRLDFLQGVLFAHTCDTMQCLADIWRMAQARCQVLTLSLPTVLDNLSAHDYLVAELHQLAAVVEAQFATPVTEDALSDSIVLHNEQRRLLHQLYQKRSDFSAELLWSLTIAGMLTPVEEHNSLLRLALRDAGSRPEPPAEGPAVILVGAVLDDPAIVQLVDELGGRVVGDDLCTGSRFFDVLVDETLEPFAALAERYLQRALCPAKHRASEPRLQRLLRLAADSEAHGAVFVLPKFCEPHAFDYAALARAFDQAGIPHLMVETEVSTPREQLRTRLQAFIEILKGRGGKETVQETQDRS